MTETQLLKAIGEIRDEFVLEADSQSFTRSSRRPQALLLKWGAAACLLAAVGIGAWRITDLPTEKPPSDTAPTNTVITFHANAIAPDNAIPESSAQPPVQLTYQAITYRFTGVYEQENTYTDEGEFTVKDIEIVWETTEDGKITAARIAEMIVELSDSDTIALRFDDAEKIYLYEKYGIASTTDST